MIDKPDLSRLTALFDNKHLKKYQKGETISVSESFKYFWFLNKGYVKRFEIMNNGSLCVQCFYGPGDAFSLTYAFKLLTSQSIYTGPETYYYEAMSDVELCRIEGSEFAAAINSNPLLYKDLFRIAGTRFLSNIQLLENKGMGDALKRVAHQILFLAKQYGTVNKHGIHIDIPITQQDIADFIDLTRESVSTAIQKLREDKILRQSRDIIVLDMDILQKFVYES